MTTWSVTVMIFASPGRLEGCIADAVAEGAEDFALQATRGETPRSRTESCTTLRLDRS